MANKRYAKQVPDHHIQADFKFLTFEGNRGQKIRRLQIIAIDDVNYVLALEVYDQHSHPSKADHPNRIWNVEFARDKLSNGRHHKMLIVQDEYTREALGVEVRLKMNCADVLEARYLKPADV